MINRTNSDYSLHSINQLVFTVDIDSVLCEIRTDFLCMIYMQVSPQSFKFHFNAIFQRENFLTKWNLRLRFPFKILDAPLNARACYMYSSPHPSSLHCLNKFLCTFLYHPVSSRKFTQHPVWLSNRHLLLKAEVICGVTPYRLVSSYRRFEGPECPDLQDKTTVTSVLKKGRTTFGLQS